MLHQNCLGIFCRNFLNFHAARCRRHKDRTRCSAVHHNAQIKLTLNRQGLFNQQPLYDLPFRPGLVRNQAHAQNLFNPVPGLSKVFGDLHAATFASSSGVDLGLHHHA